MVKNKKIGFIGSGNMAGAIIEGLIKAGASPENINVSDVDKSKLEKFNEMNINVGTDNKICCENSDILFLAVKPFHFKAVLDDIKGCDLHNKIFVSIAAGITCDFIKKGLGQKVKIIRAMPNTPLLIGEGATALCKNEAASETELEEIKNIFGKLGAAKIITEDKMNEIISVSSSSPAYIYLFIKALTDGGVKQGIDEKTAKELAAQAVIGSAKMLLQSDKTPQELIDMVTSPKGTTLEAMNVLYENNFAEIIEKAMLACTNRAVEISEGK